MSKNIDDDLPRCHAKYTDPYYPDKGDRNPGRQVTEGRHEKCMTANRGDETAVSIKNTPLTCLPRALSRFNPSLKTSIFINLL